MCARYVVARASRDLVASMGLLDPDGRPFEVTERFDVRPTAGVPVILDSTRAARSERGSTVARRTCAFARWSLTPPFSKELKTKFSTFNARSETVTEKATFRHAVPAQRTVLIADGYFEWLTSESGSKQPFYVHYGDAAGSEALLVAGLYSWWREPKTGEWILTTTMLTRAAAGPVADIHDRTPLLVHAADLNEWLDPFTIGGQSMINDFSARSVVLGESLKFHEVAPLRGVGSSRWVEPVDSLL